MVLAALNHRRRWRPGMRWAAATFVTVVTLGVIAPLWSWELFPVAGSDPATVSALARTPVALSLRNLSVSVSPKLDEENRWRLNATMIVGNPSLPSNCVVEWYCPASRLTWASGDTMVSEAFDLPRSSLRNGHGWPPLSWQSR